MKRWQQRGRDGLISAGALVVVLTAAVPALAVVPSEVPEPSAFGLVAAGAVAAVWLARRNRRK